MTGGEFYTVLMHQSNKSLAGRLAFGRMKAKQKARVIRTYKQEEVLFTGHVGVGKSALLKAVVHHSSLPTCSAHVNGEVLMLYGVGRGRPLGSYPARFIVVDSTGYDEHQGSVVKFFMAMRPQLRRVFLIIDASKGLGAPDESMLQYIASFEKPKFSVQPVLTKADLVKPGDRDEVAQQIQEAIQKALPSASPPIITCSRLGSNLGIQEMRTSIAEACGMSMEQAFRSRTAPSTTLFRYTKRRKPFATNPTRRVAFGLNSFGLRN
ncbi:uncharacterized protein B0H18DRAFT_983749 [Fomitopsis serialis]|uniref:uncharacterized protein n=1 Tax=Fomitopsis serialis TaxID=139415 RepID=UPI00200818DA|nr:uncharacterized protein B0H18DRAFT_983749 [Neoantrodia serialis]KAH9933448.1 hypothetical protein B0H18DRAFT_983749 [Neoantrodia serialis]